MADDRFMIPANVFFHSRSYKGSEIRYKYYSDLNEAIADIKIGGTIICFGQREAYSIEDKNVSVVFLGDTAPQPIFIALMTGNGNAPLGVTAMYDPLNLIPDMVFSKAPSPDGVYDWHCFPTKKKIMNILYGGDGERSNQTNHALAYATITPCNDDGFGGGQYLYGTSIGWTGNPSNPAGSIYVYGIVGGALAPADLASGTTFIYAVYNIPKNVKNVDYQWDDLEHPNA